MFVTTPALPQVGINQSVVPFRAPKESFHNLVNFRYSPETAGLLEQTPYFTASSYGRGNYYSGGTLQEPVGSSIRLLSAGLTMTDYVLRDSAGTQMKVFYQSTNTSTATIYTGCRLVINNLTTLAVNLGSTLDVEMTATAAFRWRKNGGAWTAGVPSTAGVSIDGGNATLYFLANTGFAGTETWTWTRTDASFATGSATVYKHMMIYYRGVAYFTSIDYRIMCVERTTADGVDYAISVGYRPVYGVQLAVFDDHLIVGYFGTTAGAYNAAPRQVTIGWSDKGDLHNFISTDINEADSLVLAYTRPNDTIGQINSSYAIVGLAVIKQQLFVFTTNGYWTTSSLGLPLVFSFVINEAPPLLLSSGLNVIPAENKVYLLDQRAVYSFDGVSMTRISLPIENYPSSTTPVFYYSFSAGSAFYDRWREELVILDTAEKQLVCYQEKHNAWYLRGVSFTNAPTCMYSDSVYRLVIGAGSRTIYTEDYKGLGGSTIEKDASSGASYTVPKITTQMYGNLVSSVEEISSVFLGVNASSTIESFYGWRHNINTGAYSTGANIQVQVYWYLSDYGLISGSPSTHASAVWTSAKPDRKVSFPRIAFRTIAFELQVTGLDGTKPPLQLQFVSIEPSLRSAPAVER